MCDHQLIAVCSCPAEPDVLLSLNCALVRHYLAMRARGAVCVRLVFLFARRLSPWQSSSDPVLSHGCWPPFFCSRSIKGASFAPRGWRGRDKRRGFPREPRVATTGPNPLGRATGPLLWVCALFSPACGNLWNGVTRSVAGRGGREAAYRNRANRAAAACP